MLAKTSLISESALAVSMGDVSVLLKELSITKMDSSIKIVLSTFATWLLILLKKISGPISGSSLRQKSCMIFSSSCASCRYYLRVTVGFYSMVSSASLKLGSRYRSSMVTLGTRISRTSILMSLTASATIQLSGS